MITFNGSRPNKYYCDETENGSEIEWVGQSYIFWLKVFIALLSAEVGMILSYCSRSL